MKIRALIVDDVELARERIKMLLNDDQIEIVGEAGSGFDAVKAIADLNPDLVFLDVQMPEMDGFEVIETVGVEEMPATVFITAYDKFALRAFDANAVDYVVKPFDRERLTKAVTRVKREIERRAPDELKKRLEILLKEINPEPKFIRRIPVKSARGIALLPVEEINWINAAGHYVRLHTTAGETHLVRRQITQLEQKLDPEKFVRVHRSSIVNVDRIKSLHPLFNGDHLIVLHNGKELNMSRTYHEKLMMLLER